MRVSGDESPDRWLTAALAEFQALRSEIDGRIQHQQVLLGLNITALGTLLSVALATNTSQATVLLAAPFVASALGFAYSDHTRRINLLGKYIRERLWPDVRGLTAPGLSSWEEGFVDQVSLRTPFQAGLSSAYIVALFVVTPVAMVVYAGFRLHWDLTGGEWILWALGIATTLVYSAYASAVALRHGLDQPPGGPK